MNGRDQSDELQQLRAQLAELTRRVYHLEGLLAAHAEQPLATPTTSHIELGPPALPSTHVAPPPPASPAPPILRKAPKVSLESRIGGQWLNRVGIIAVLVGLSYFLKLAFENNWIGPATQVLIGIAAGLGLLLWSERFRSKGYAGFAYSLKAVSFGSLYLSLWAASQYYHLVPPTVTFIGMVLVTLTSAALSLRQNAELLAAFALVGGFLTPVLISTGQNHEFALCCYLALLDLGTLWITGIRRWYRVLLGAYLGTAILAGAWAVTYYTETQQIPTFWFATFFFVLFLAAPFLELKNPVGSEMQNVIVATAVLNACGYFAALYLMLDLHARSELVLVLMAVAVVYFVCARYFERRRASLFASIHLALAVGFLTVALPIEFNGPALTLGWLVEACVLIWRSHAERSRLLRGLGVAAMALGITRLALIDSDTYQPLILNTRFGLYVLAIASLALLAYYARGEGGEENRKAAAVAVVALNVLALVALHFEVIDYFRPAPMQRLGPAQWSTLHIARDFTYSAIWMLYGGALMLIGFWKRSAFLRWQAIVLLTLTAAKVFFYDVSALERGYRIVAFIVLGGILLAVSFFYQRSRVRAAE